MNCILRRHLQRSFGLSGLALAWYNVSEPAPTVRVGDHSEMTTIQFVVLQAVCLAQYCSCCIRQTYVRLVEQYGFNAHQYADHTQLYGWCQLGNSASLCHDLGDCVEGVAQWMSSSRLQLNAGKTEFMWCVSPLRRHHLPADSLMVQSAAVAPLMSISDLTSAYISTMTCQCTRTSRSWFVRATSLRSIRRSLPRSALTTLVTSFITSKVDYCNAALAGLPQCDLNRVQSVVNATAYCKQN